MKWNEFFLENNDSGAVRKSRMSLITRNSYIEIVVTLKDKQTKILKQQAI